MTVLYGHQICILDLIKQLKATLKIVLDWMNIADVGKGLWFPFLTQLRLLDVYKVL